MNIFKTHPHLKEYWETTDGKKFYTPNTASLHARSLAQDSRDVKHVVRPESVNENKAVIPSAPEKKSLSQMNRKELDAEAVKLGYDSTALGSKALVIAEIEKIISAKAESAEETGKESSENGEESDTETDNK